MSTSDPRFEYARKWLENHGYFERGDGTWAYGPGHDVEVHGLLVEFMIDHKIGPWPSFYSEKPLTRPPTTP